MLYLALSCLQGRTMSAAAGELLALGPVGLQLTPGCAPTHGFEERLIEYKIATRTHHGFCWDASRQPVWDGPDLATSSDSVHPPRIVDVSPDAFFTRARTGAYNDVALETMYPGMCLGTGEEIEQAMGLGLQLAVDVSHVWMQLTQGVMTAATWQRLQRYDRVAEIHLSSNDGTRDQHRSVDANTFGLGWAATSGATGVPIVLENYMHRQPVEDRQRDVAFILAELERGQS